MKQKIVALIEVITELEDLVTIPDPDDRDKKDLDCALREFIRLFGSLTLEFLNDELKKKDDEYKKILDDEFNRIRGVKK